MYRIAAPNYVVLAVLLIAAATGIYGGMRRIRNRIAAGKSETDGPLASGGLFAAINWRAFLFRAALNGRLLKRWASGTAHSLLFFGFIVLVLGHALYAFELAGIPVYSGQPGYVLRTARDVAGIMVLLGLLFFIIRRQIPTARLRVGKARRGFLSIEFLLLAVVVAGFLSEAFRLTDPAAPDQGQFLGQFLAGVLNHYFDPGVLVTGNLVAWWLHGLIGLAFVGLFAYTPMSHMLLGPLNAALANKRSGINLAPIKFEDEAGDDAELRLGASKLADFSQRTLLDASACLWCGRCHEVCPAAATGKSLSPKLVMLTCAEYLEQGKTDDVSLADALGMQAMFDCTTCGACIEECPVSNKPAEAIVEVRRHFVMERSEMPPTMASAIRNMDARGHPFVGTSANPEAWRKGLSVPFFEPGKTEYLLWLGCSVIYEERAQQVARAMVKILDAAGVSYGILSTARCTGDPAKMMGNEIQFVEIAQTNIDEFNAMQIHKVITLCAHCFNSFDRYYPELGAQWETIPHVVLIEQLIREHKIAPVKTSETITLHDSCYLARQNDIVDETRTVISAVGNLVEMPRNRKNSFCCGGGGGNYWGGGGGTARISDVRSDEALATGAQKIATSCPFCLLTLTAGVGRHTAERKVHDLAELVAEALPTPSP